MKPERTRKASAFTLLELLVATAITAVLMTLMVAIISSISKSWNTTSGKLTSEGEARLVLDQLTQDLQGAIYRSDGNVWMAATILPDSAADSAWTKVANEKPAASSTNLAATASTTTDMLIPASAAGQLSSARFGRSGVVLQFFTNQPGTNTSGNTSTLSAPVAVCYRLMRLPITSDSSSQGYMLYRGSVTPQLTFTTGYNFSTMTSAGNYAKPTDAASPPAANALAGTVASASCPVRAEMLAQNIVDFGIRMYVRQTVTSGTTSTTNYRLVFPATAIAWDPTNPPTTPPDATAHPAGTLYAASSIAAGDTQTYHYSSSNTAPSYDYYANTFPSRIDVMIRVLTQEGVKQLALFENPPTGYTPPAGQTWWSIVQANSVVYTRSIQINAQPF